jgi:hypothetical protein
MDVVAGLRPPRGSTNCTPKHNWIGHRGTRRARSQCPRCPAWDRWRDSPPRTNSCSWPPSAGLVPTWDRPALCLGGPIRLIMHESEAPRGKSARCCGGQRRTTSMRLSPSLAVVPRNGVSQISIRSEPWLYQPGTLSSCTSVKVSAATPVSSSTPPRVGLFLPRNEDPRVHVEGCSKLPLAPICCGGAV